MDDVEEQRSPSEVMEGVQNFSRRVPVATKTMVVDTIRANFVSRRVAGQLG